MEDIKELFKIPQHPYDGDTFAICILPNKRMSYEEYTSYAINNYQPEGVNTKIFYNGYVWGPNTIVRLILRGHCCNARIEQYFTYVEVIDTWVCYWQIVPYNQNKSKIVVNYYAITLNYNDRFSSLYEYFGKDYGYLKPLHAEILNEIREMVSANSIDYENVDISFVSSKSYEIPRGEIFTEFVQYELEETHDYPAIYSVIDQHEAYTSSVLVGDIHTNYKKFPLIFSANNKKDGNNFTYDFDNKLFIDIDYQCNLYDLKPKIDQMFEDYPYFKDYSRGKLVCSDDEAEELILSMDSHINSMESHNYNVYGVDYTTAFNAMHTRGFHYYTTSGFEEPDPLTGFGYTYGARVTCRPQNPSDFEAKPPTAAPYVGEYIYPSLKDFWILNSDVYYDKEKLETFHVELNNIKDKYKKNVLDKQYFHNKKDRNGEVFYYTFNNIKIFQENDYRNFSYPLNDDGFNITLSIDTNIYDFNFNEPLSFPIKRYEKLQDESILTPPVPMYCYGSFTNRRRYEDGYEFWDYDQYSDEYVKNKINEVWTEMYQKFCDFIHNTYEYNDKITITTHNREIVPEPQEGSHYDKVMDSPPWDEGNLHPVIMIYVDGTGSLVNFQRTDLYSTGGSDKYYKGWSGEYTEDSIDFNYYLDYSGCEEDKERVKNDKYVTPLKYYNNMFYSDFIDETLRNNQVSISFIADAPSHEINIYQIYYSDVYIGNDYEEPINPYL